MALILVGPHYLPGPSMEINKQDPLNVANRISIAVHGKKREGNDDMPILTARNLI